MYTDTYTNTALGAGQKYTCIDADIDSWTGMKFTALGAGFKITASEAGMKFIALGAGFKITASEAEIKFTALGAGFKITA